MDAHDDDERAAAYQRYIFAEFANIVHNYDDTATPDHDNIVYDHHDLDNLDGAEYDDDGNPVLNYGLLFVFFRAVNDDDPGADDDCPDDAEARAARFFDAWAEADQYNHDSPPDNFYRLPLYDPRRGPCKRPYGFFYTSRYFPRPPV